MDYFLSSGVKIQKPCKTHLNIVFHVNEMKIVSKKFKTVTIIQKKCNFVAEMVAV